jgi:hypothetical protein
MAFAARAVEQAARRPRKALYLVWRCSAATEVILRPWHAVRRWFPLEAQFLQT